MTNFCFHYLYRDASNYKNWGEIVFKSAENANLEELENRIRSMLIDEKFFTAEEVGIPTLYFKDWSRLQDVTWHEFSGLSSTASPSTVTGSIESLIALLAKRTKTLI
jgi:hypothetical protein